MQAIEPMMPHPILASALQSEYTSKYTTKADATKINHRIILTAWLLSKATKTDQQVKTKTLIKWLRE